MRNHVLIGVALFICLLFSIGAAGVGYASNGAFVSTSVEVDPQQPTTDDEFNVTVSLANMEDSDDRYRIESAELLDENGDQLEEFDSSVPTLSPGETRDVTFETEINETGLHDLTAEVVLSQEPFGRVEHEITAPVQVRVYSPEVQLQVRTERLVAESWQPVEVSIANPHESPVRDISLAVESDEIEFVNDQAVFPSISSSEMDSAQFRARPNSPGIHPVTATVTYVDPDGEYREQTTTVSADFTPPTNPGSVSLVGITSEEEDSVVEITGDAVNRGGDVVESVLVSVPPEAATPHPDSRSEYFVGSLEASDFATFTVGAALDEGETSIPLEVTYVIDDVERSKTVDVPVAPRESQYQGATTDGGLPLSVIGGSLVVVLLVLSVGWKITT